MLAITYLGCFQNARAFQNEKQKTLKKNITLNGTMALFDTHFVKDEQFSFSRGWG